MKTKPCEACKGTGCIPDPPAPLILCKGCNRKTRASGLTLYNVYQSYEDCGSPNGAYWRHGYDMFECPKCGELNTDHAPCDNEWTTHPDYLTCNSSKFKNHVNLYQDDYIKIEKVLEKFLTTGENSK